MPPVPSPHALGALGVTVVTLAVFASGRVRIELACLGVIAVLALGFYLAPFEVAGRYTGMQVAFGGFGHEALIAICCLMILGRGLVVTGALDPAAHALANIWRRSRTLGMAFSLLICAALSMFVNDTPVLVLALPILLSLAVRAGVPASKTLMPVNCAILIGGMGTTIGTSTNLLVTSIASDLGVPHFGVFAFTDIALIAAAVAFPYLWFIMPRLLPTRTPEETEAPRHYASVMFLGRTAPDRTLGTLRARFSKLEISDVAHRAGGAHLAGDHVLLREGDRLFVSGTADMLLDASGSIGAHLADPVLLAEITADADERSEIERLAHFVVGADATLIGQSVKAARIADRYQVAVLGASRSTRMPGVERSPVVEQLDTGDVLLVRGAPSRLKGFEIGEGLHMLDGAQDLPRTSKALVALIIVASVILLAATRILPIAVSALAGTIAMLAAGCVRLDRIGRALSAEVILLVAASIALGRALVETGAADWLAALFAAGLSTSPPALVLAALMVFVAVLTNFVSNAAAAAIGTPLAVSLAHQLSINAEPLVLAVLFGCNLCYVTPMAYQTNLLIMGAARYEFRDFVRAGLPLAVLMIVTLAILLVRRYGL
ncbi:MAG: SLC13 family permease [Gammaproteobacteria bacterium]